MRAARAPPKIIVIRGRGRLVDLCTANVSIIYGISIEILFGLYKSAMSLTETVVSLKLQSGKKFDEIPIKHTECTLAEFLDETLKELEVFISETCKMSRGGGGGVVYLLIKLHTRTGSS